MYLELHQQLSETKRPFRDTRIPDLYGTTRHLRSIAICRPFCVDSLKRRTQNHCRSAFSRPAGSQACLTPQTKQVHGARLGDVAELGLLLHLDGLRALDKVLVPHHRGVATQRQHACQCGVSEGGGRKGGTEKEEMRIEERK